jgi:hypothetical protein
MPCCAMISSRILCGRKYTMNHLLLCPYRDVLEARFFRDLASRGNSNLTTGIVLL